MEKLYSDKLRRGTRSLGRYEASTQSLAVFAFDSIMFICNRTQTASDSPQFQVSSFKLQESLSQLYGMQGICTKGEMDESGEIEVRNESVQLLSQQ